MIASLSSFIPSAFSLTQNKPVQVVEVSETTGNDTDDAKSFKDEQDISSKKRDKKDKTPQEACSPRQS